MRTKKFNWERPGIGQNLFTLFVVGLCSSLVLYSIEFIFDKERKFMNVVYKYWHYLGVKPGTFYFLIN